MAHTSSQLSPDVLAALARGDTIDAIRLLRQSSGLGLKEAKDLIDAHQSGRTAPIRPAAPAVALPPPVVDAMQRGDKIGAIKLLREHSGLGLKEAKDAVEAWQGSTADGSRPGAPGGVAGSGGAIWWLAAMAAAGAAYFLLRAPG